MYKESAEESYFCYRFTSSIFERIFFHYLKPNTVIVSQKLCTQLGCCCTFLLHNLLVIKSILD